MESRVPNQEDQNAWKVNSRAGCPLALLPESLGVCSHSLCLFLLLRLEQHTGDYLANRHQNQHLSNHGFTNHVVPFLRSYIFLSIAIMCVSVCVYMRKGEGKGSVQGTPVEVGDNCVSDFSPSTLMHRLWGSNSGAQFCTANALTGWTTSPALRGC